MKKAQQISAILSLLVTALVPLNTNASLFHFNDLTFSKEISLSAHINGMASNDNFNGKFLIVGETQKNPSVDGEFSLFLKHTLFTLKSDKQFLDSSGFSRNSDKAIFRGLIPGAANFLANEKTDLSLHTLSNPTFYSDTRLSLPPIDEIKWATSPDSNTQVRQALLTTLQGL